VNEPIDYECADCRASALLEKRILTNSGCLKPPFVHVGRAAACRRNRSAPADRRYLPANLSRPEIAGQLSVSPNTVNAHIRAIYAKLQVSDRSAAVRRARELRLLAAGRAR
jgi:Bacterial regulatory proteins, luxR family